MKNTVRLFENKPKIDNLLKTLDSKKKIEKSEKPKETVKSPEKKKMMSLDKVQVVVPVTITKTPQKALLAKKESRTVEKKKETITTTPNKVPIKVKPNSTANKNDSMMELKNLLKKEIVDAVAKKRTTGSS